MKNPQTPEPLSTIPTARPRYRSNQREAAVLPGMISPKQTPIPLITPKPRRNSQGFVVANARNSEPPQTNAEPIRYVERTPKRTIEMATSVEGMPTKRLSSVDPDRKSVV